MESLGLRTVAMVDSMDDNVVRYPTGMMLAIFIVHLGPVRQIQLM